MKIKELLPVIKTHGRVFYDEQAEALFANWTCSGFTIGVTGTELKVKVHPMSDIVPGPPGFPEPTPDFPCVGAAVDGSEDLINRTECLEDQWITLWKADSEESHEIRVVKISENARGKLGIVEVETDGHFYEPKKEKKLTVEIIGDSITCGYGNESSADEPKFHTSQENGWMSYAAQAARALDADFSILSESGICAVRPEHPLFPMHTMSEIYEDRDNLYDVKMGNEPVMWDFANNHTDVVVVSLGTNDCNPIKFYRDFNDVEKIAAWFEDRYVEFIEQIRRANGPDTFILCTLGSIDYYLYPNILNAVKRYKAATGDTKVDGLGFVPTNVMFEGIGAHGHPSRKAHDRMAKELVTMINKKVLGK